jgi:hypothetical protein
MNVLRHIATPQPDSHGFLAMKQVLDSYRAHS